MHHKQLMKEFEIHTVIQKYECNTGIYYSKFAKNHSHANPIQKFLKHTSH